MNAFAAPTPADNGTPADNDPRRARSRARLLDAAAGLLSSGGVEAVTVDAVTRASKVARATLYRHFASTNQLIAATFERLLPQVDAPAANLPFRERLVELLDRQASLIEETPMHITTLAWLAMGRNQLPEIATDSGAPDGVDTLRSVVRDRYRRTFDASLDTPDARAQLRVQDPDLAICQLLGPIVFARLTGLPRIDRAGCTLLVDAALLPPADSGER